MRFAFRSATGLLILALLPCCSREGEEAGHHSAAPPVAEAGAPAAASEEDRILWETPPAPWPVRMFVDGREVSADVVRGWLEPEWQHFFQARYDRAGTEEERQAAEAAFLADPAARFEGLVRAVLMLREAERRRPEITEEEFARILADFRRDGGAMYETMSREMGEEGVRAHLERVWRLHKLEEDFQADVPAPSEAAIAEEYQRVVEEFVAENPGHSPPGYDEIRDRLADKLVVEERNRRIEAMIDEQRARARVELVLPDGRRVSLPPPKGAAGGG